MADQYFRYVDGVLKRYTAAEYSSSFGSAPTQPRSGERLFGTRYENGTFYTGSVDANNGLPTQGGQLKNPVVDSGSNYNYSGSYNLGSFIDA